MPNVKPGVVHDKLEWVVAGDPGGELKKLGIINPHQSTKHAINAYEVEAQAPGFQRRQLKPAEPFLVRQVRKFGNHPCHSSLYSF